MAEKNMNENKKDGMDEATAEPKVLDKPESFDLCLDRFDAKVSADCSWQSAGFVLGVDGAKQVDFHELCVIINQMVK